LTTVIAVVSKSDAMSPRETGRMKTEVDANIFHDLKRNQDGIENERI
jgi:hypothetical protein